MPWSMHSHISAYATWKCRRRRSGCGVHSATATPATRDSPPSCPALCRASPPCLLKPWPAGMVGTRPATIAGGGDEPMQKSYVRGTWQQKRAFSPCVITQGAARTIYIAGHTGQVDETGKSLAGDFDAQFRQTFRNIENTL